MTGLVEGRTALVTGASRRIGTAVAAIADSYAEINMLRLLVLSCGPAGPAPAMAVMDWMDEVHKVTVARNVLEDYEPHDGPWPSEYLPAKRERQRRSTPASSPRIRNC